MSADQAAADDLAMMCKDWDQHAEVRMAKFAVGNLVRAYLVQQQEIAEMRRLLIALRDDNVVPPWIQTLATTALARKETP